MEFIFNWAARMGFSAPEDEDTLGKAYEEAQKTVSEADFGDGYDVEYDLHSITDENGREIWSKKSGVSVEEFISQYDKEADIKQVSWPFKEQIVACVKYLAEIGRKHDANYICEVIGTAADTEADSLRAKLDVLKDDSRDMYELARRLCSFFDFKKVPWVEEPAPYYKETGEAVPVPGYVSGTAIYYPMEEQLTDIIGFLVRRHRVEQAREIVNTVLHYPGKTALEKLNQADEDEIYACSRGAASIGIVWVERPWCRQAVPYSTADNCLVYNREEPDAICSSDSEEMMAADMKAIWNIASVSSLGLSDRVTVSLTRAKVSTVGDLLEKSRKDLFRLRNIGRAAADEIEEVLSQNGLALKEETADENT